VTFWLKQRSASGQAMALLCLAEATVAEGKGGVQVGVHAVWEGHGGLLSGWPMYAPSVDEINWCVFLRRSSGQGEGQERCVSRKRVVTLPSYHFSPACRSVRDRS
jgi:hypothetical protein